ncbi:MAG: hypothetical protein JRJ51_07285 [Deltaproteobacteria bacterium]|nr:hypothetical protein [Deltaproteobacteria bacterium]
MASADIFIQAGHKNRTSGATGAVNNRVGISELEDLNTITSTAVGILRGAGVTVIHEDATLQDTYKVAVAVFCHFDGNSDSRHQKASVGYDDPTDKPAASAWKTEYGKIWPYGFHSDNFTSNLSGYYGFKYTRTTDAEFVIEFGTISNDEAAQWIKDRLVYLGGFLAWFLSKRIGKGNVPKPVYEGDIEEDNELLLRVEAIEKELSEGHSHEIKCSCVVVS